jgi:hypothetical protein
MPSESRRPKVVTALASAFAYNLEHHLPDLGPSIARVQGFIGTTLVAGSEARVLDSGTCCEPVDMD